MKESRVTTGEKEEESKQELAEKGCFFSSLWLLLNKRPTEQMWITPSFGVVSRHVGDPCPSVILPRAAPMPSYRLEKGGMEQGVSARQVGGMEGGRSGDVTLLLLKSR